MHPVLLLLDELPEIHRVPFLMFYRGYQYDEIAQHLDVPMGTIKSRIFFARKVMRRKIKTAYGDIGLD